MELKQFSVAVVGYGNVGQCVVEAIQQSADMRLAGIVEVPQLVETLKQNVKAIPLVADPLDLGEIDVAILAVNSLAVPKIAPTYLKRGINTVDPYDIHGDSALKLKKHLDKLAKEYGCVSIIAAGWDPGTDSIIRTIFEIITPEGITNVNFGPGMSMGHTVVVKGIKGVKDAISITVPLGMGIHKRMVYVELYDGYDLENISRTIKDNQYFINDETHVFSVKNVKELIDMGHGVRIERKGVAGKTHNQRLEFNMSITNPAATGQVLVSAARASLKQRPGCYSLPEIPPLDFIYGDREQLLHRLI